MRLSASARAKSIYVPWLRHRGDDRVRPLVQASFVPPWKLLEASFTLMHPWSPLDPWSPLRAPFKTPWSPLELKPPSSPLRAPFKPPSCPLQAPFVPPSSPLQPPFSLSSSPLHVPFKPPSSFLHLEAPLKPPGKPRACRRSGFRTDESLHLQSGTQTQSHPTRMSSGRTFRPMETNDWDWRSVKQGRGEWNLKMKSRLRLKLCEARQGEWNSDGESRGKNVCLVTTKQTERRTLQSAKVS